MTFDVITIFPDFFKGPFEYGVISRGRASGKIRTRIHDLRKYTDDRHQTVDDRPFGGGEGMVLKPEPIFRAVEAIRESESAEVTDLSESVGRCSQAEAL